MKLDKKLVRELYCAPRLVSVLLEMYCVDHYPTKFRVLCTVCIGYYCIIIWGPLHSIIAFFRFYSTCSFRFTATKLVGKVY